MTNKIYIRADANPDIGMGHIMRCLSIADAASITGQEVTFILADESVQDLIASRGYNAFILHSKYNAMEDEIIKWPKLKTDLIIVDSYNVTPSYLQMLREKTGKLVYLDDLAAFPYPVDTIVNYNIYADKIAYEEIYKSSGIQLPQLLLGVYYAPLRAMFRDVPKRAQPHKVENILISTGGSDELHLALAMIRQLQGSRGKEQDHSVYHFLIGVMNTDREIIKQCAKNQNNIMLHENVYDMKSLISSCDLAVSAAGSTLYEIAACGVPMIIYLLADNQKAGAETFGEKGLAVNIGDMRNPDMLDADTVTVRPDAVKLILSGVEKLKEDYYKRCEIGKNMQALIDGFGADRIVEELMRTI